MMLRVGLALYYLCLFVLSGAERCPVHFKPASEAADDNGNGFGNNAVACESITSADPLLALQWLTTTEDIVSFETPGALHPNEIDTESTKFQCHIWSIRKQRLPNKCDRADFSFETSWVNAGCKVTLTYSSYSSKCLKQVSRVVSKLNVTVSTSLSKAPRDVHLLRIHDNNSGSMAAILSELYVHADLSGSVLRRIPLVSLDLVTRAAALQDEGAGEPSARAWQLWSAAHLLQAEHLAVDRVAPRAGGGVEEGPLQYTGGGG